MYAKIKFNRGNLFATNYLSFCSRAFFAKFTRYIMEKQLILI